MVLYLHTDCMFQKQMFRCMCIHICSMTDSSTYVCIHIFHGRWFNVCTVYICSTADDSMNVCLYAYVFRDRGFYVHMCMKCTCICFMIDELYVHYIYIYA